MKRKSLARLKSDLWNKLRPEVHSVTLAAEITEFLNKHAGEAARNVNVANNLAAYLTQKYSVGNRKTGQLRSLIECHSEDLAGFLDQISFKEYQFLLKNIDKLPPTKKKIRVNHEHHRSGRNDERKPKTDMSRAGASTATV